MKGTIGIALSFFTGFGLVLGCDPVTAFAQAVFPVVESLQHGWGYFILAIPIVGLVALFLQASK
jgi:hypothetical protein